MLVQEGVLVWPRSFKDRGPFSSRWRAVLALLLLIQIGVWYRRFFEGTNLRHVGQVAYSPTGESLAWTSEGDGGDGELVIWDLVRGRLRYKVRARDCEPTETLNEASAFTFLAFSKDGRTIAASFSLRSRSRTGARVVLLERILGPQIHRKIARFAKPC